MEPVKDMINLEESIGKTVGHRRAPSAREASAGLQESGSRMFRRWGKGIPKGVYRFHSHEEADRHLLRSYARDV